MPATESGGYIAIVKPVGDGVKLQSITAGAAVSTGVEYRHLTTDHVLLEQIARESKGRVLDLSAPAKAKLFDRTGIMPRQARTALWRPLLLWTLLVLLLDVGTRRVAWDRFVSREFGVDLRRAARESVQDRGAKAAKVVSKLREAPKRVQVEPAARLSDEDAERVAAAETERRRQARLAAVQAARERQKQEWEGQEFGAGLSEPQKPPPKPEPRVERSLDEKPEGLLAAKRRARERMEGDGDGG